MIFRHISICHFHQEDLVIRCFQSNLYKASLYSVSYPSEWENKQSNCIYLAQIYELVPAVSTSIQLAVCIVNKQKQKALFFCHY